ncbi:O-glycosyl hydrolase [Cellulosimicrobium cellulans]|uniref:family 43 glycosylhydrolase n=1 Tax=Cellulosimicrobium cellulans TaxID=1710 RepID=UPI00195B0A98|nr:glycoside hydrolase [Cellulosimicrobium cellulans]MBM7818733.1 O-glycosyl hydrolase [Cellulosimicrobium cellulans]
MKSRRTVPPLRRLAAATSATALVASGAFVLVPAATAATPDVVLAPNPAYAGTDFKGWGTSLVWMANATGDYPAELRDQLVDMVFGDDGLNLNIARYNVGGGNASDVPAYLRPGGAVPGWWNPDAPLSDDQGPISSSFADRDRFRAAWTGDAASDYDLTADSAQLAWVAAIKDDVDTWEAFSNSPPYFMTNSGFVSGGQNPDQDQIRTDSVDEFAKYLKTVVQHVEESQGIEFDTIDPLNEPNTNYWKTTLGSDGWPTSASRQEGAHAGPALQSQVIEALEAELAKPGTTTGAKISGPDETNPGRFVEDWNGWTAETKAIVDQLNVHTYSTNDRHLARDVAKSTGKPLWMSEVEGNWGGDWWNPASIDNGLGIADLVNDDLRELEAEAWVLWQPVEDLYNMEKVEKKNWGSIFVDFDCDAEGNSARRLADGDPDPSCGVEVNSKYNTLRNFTHYIEPGDRLVRVDDNDTTAAIDGDGSGATLVHTNHGDSARTVQIDLSMFGEVGPGATVTPVVTTASPESDRTANALVAGSPVAVDPETRSAVLTVPARSVTTFVVSDVSGVAPEAPALRDGATYTITGVQSDRPLAAGESGARLASGDPDEARSWTATRVGDESGTARDRFVLRTDDGRALAADASGGTTFATVTDEEAVSDASVQWLMTSTDGRTFSLLNAARGQVLDVADASTDAGARVGLWSSNWGANQAWTLDEPRDAVTDYTSFRPGQEWLDDNGQVIQAHGGQVVPSKDDDGRTIYYLYGEDRTNGYHSAPGVHVYSSYDLYNWKDQGVALRAMTSTDQFESDPYFRSLYGNYTQAQRDAVYRDLGTVPVDGVTPPIIERPKVIYNESTGKWVMWAHMDGPWGDWTAQYAKARAGVAVADSPFGPFRYIDSYRLHHAPAGDPTNKAAGNPGMARDMNLFVDDDGTGYIIYSSEENATMFISKLDEEYTGLATAPDEAVLGVDYNRIFVNESRESPAIFKHDDRYFLITSGTTGWSPNPAQYASSSDLMGTWTTHGDPFPWWAQSNSWNSQPSSVIPVDRENGKYVYMGDRWNGGGDLKNAQMVWLPLNMGEGGDSLAVEVWDEWTLDDLDQWAAWDVTGVPATVPVGGGLDVPTVTVTQNGTATEQPVTWHVAGSFDTPGVVTATGTLPGFGGRTFTRTIPVVPEGLRYAVNAGGQPTSDWSALTEAAAARDLLNSTPDRALGADGETGATWGYESDGSRSHGSVDGSMFSTLRYAVEGRDLTYRFAGLEEGRYTVYAGYADPWDQWDDRGARVSVNGAVREEDRDFGAEDAVGTYGDVVVDSTGEITFSLSPTRGADVQLSWVWVVLDEPAAPSLDVTATAATRCVASGSVLTVRVDNAEDSPVAVTVTSPYGTRSFPAVGAGKAASHVFTTRERTLPPGTVTVRVSDAAGGTASRTLEAPYEESSCA